MTRLSDTTRYEYGTHMWGHHCISHTNVSFYFAGHYYGCRFDGTLTPAQLEVEEERFIERRYGRRY